MTSPAGAPPLVVDTSGIGTDAVGQVDPGDVVQVFGVVTGDARIEATRLVVHERGNQRRMYVISAIGGLLAAGTFLRRWRVDWRRLAFVPRTDGGGGGDNGSDGDDGGGDRSGAVDAGEANDSTVTDDPAASNGGEDGG